MTFCNNETCLTKEYCSCHISKASEIGLSRHLLHQENFMGDEFMCPVAGAKEQAKKESRYKKGRK